MIRVLLYMPVIHAGYDRFLSMWSRRGAIEILVLGRTISDMHPELRKEVRALSPARAVAYLNGGGGYPPARVVESEGLAEAVRGGTVVLPDEDVCRQVVKDFHLRTFSTVKFDKTFLRWDRKWSEQTRPADFQGRVAADETEALLAKLALATAQSSSDWWRQVGAVAVMNGRVVARAHNRHLPTEYAPYLNSDPRNAYSRGVRPDLSTAIHAEAALIAECAKRGQRLAGADMFVSTFPCPSCARLIAVSGFRRVYFSAGYSMLEGEEVLRVAGVELVFVDTEASSQFTQLAIEDSFGVDTLLSMVADAASEDCDAGESHEGSSAEPKSGRREGHGARVS